MTIDDPFGVGWMLGALIWAAVIGVAVGIGVLTLLLFGSTGRETAAMALDRSDAGTATPPAQPAEEGGRLDEWGEDRLDRAA